MSIGVSHISFCISLFSLVIFEHLSRGVLHCRLRMLDKCSSSDRFQRKQPQYSTHSLIPIKWTQKINSIMYFKETRLRWKCLEKRNNFVCKLFFKWPEKRFWVQARGRVVSSYDARARPGWHYPELDNGVRSPAEASYWSAEATAGLWLVTSDPGLRCTISSQPGLCMEMESWVCGR